MDWHNYHRENEIAQADKSVMEILGEDWGRQQAATILKDLANNQSESAAAAGAGLGMGIGAAVFWGVWLIRYSIH